MMSDTLNEESANVSVLTRLNLDVDIQLGVKV